ncbi:MAG TPA: hypothetical protein ENK49_09625 [Gammaproteobacteria bacterium]|nr:hypothetical protein [Gammaproteobacteria bacterium]
MDSGQWAWEFLRRNPEYQQDWQWFHARWETLEARYGKPPERDFQRWKNDPLAYHDIEDTGAECQVEQDQVLIECWMGAKWGFYKFPLDPATEQPVIGEQLSWLEVEVSAQVVRDSGSPYLQGEPARTALGFDLAMPLREQLETAKRYLQMRQARLRREGAVTLQTIGSCRERWTLMLRLLDGLRAGEHTDELAAVTGQPGVSGAALLAEAQSLVNGGYRGILRIPDGRKP